MITVFWLSWNLLSREEISSTFDFKVKLSLYISCFKIAMVFS